MTIFQQLQKTVRKFPKKKAIGYIEEGQLSYWTYQEFHDRVVAASEGFASLGLKKGDRVVLLSENGPEWAVVDFAAARLGLILVPIHTTLSGEQVRWIIKQSGAKALVLGYPGLMDSFCALHELLSGLQTTMLKLIEAEFPAVKHLILFDALSDYLDERQKVCYLSEVIAKGRERLQQKKSPRTGAVKSSDLATIMYTSGTTGEMKGVMLTHNNLVSNAMAGVKLVGASSRERYLSILPLSHAYEHVGGLYNCMFLGATYIFGRGPLSLIEDLKIVRPTWTSVVPRILEKVCAGINENIQKKSKLASTLFAMGLQASRMYHQAQSNNNPFGFLLKLQDQMAHYMFYQKIHEKLGGHLHTITSGGAALDVRVAQFFESIGIRVLEGYGLTEASPIVTVNPKKKKKIGSVGVPLPKVKVRIGDNDEILVKGPNVMLGYEKNIKETRKAIDKNGWLHTGDQGYFDEEGYLYIKGRVKEMLVTAYGKNVYPGPIETELERSPYIQQAMLYGEGHPYLVALLVPEKEALKRVLRSNGKVKINWSTLYKKSKVQSLLHRELERCSRKLARHEHVKKFTICPEEFTQFNGLLTPTLKLRRREIAKRYSSQLESLYKQEK